MSGNKSRDGNHDASVRQHAFDAAFPPRTSTGTTHDDHPSSGRRDFLTRSSAGLAAAIAAASSTKVIAAAIPQGNGVRLSLIQDPNTEDKTTCWSVVMIARALRMI